MRFAILGPLEVRGQDGPLSVGGPQQRALLTALLVRANEPVSSENLAIALWGDDAPHDRVNAVHVNVSRLRKSLEGDGHVLETTSAGYRLRVAAEELDASVFARLVEEAVAAKPERSLELASAALALWRGEPLADSATAPFARAEIAKLRELRLAALETRAAAAIGLGRHVETIPALRELAEQHPEREAITRC
jgi:DNA-binding SARP family transcriptional activator